MGKDKRSLLSSIEMEALNSRLETENQSLNMQIVSSFDEKDLLLLLKQGNEQAFERIYNLYKRRLHLR